MMGSLMFLRSKMREALDFHGRIFFSNCDFFKTESKQTMMRYGNFQLKSDEI